jgi:hypothetical protein
MSREFRTRPAGLFFYAIVGLLVALTSEGQRAISAASNQTGSETTGTALVAAATAVAALLTSDAAGFAFGALHAFWWNRLRGRFRPEGGFSREWEGLLVDPRSVVQANFEQAARTSDDPQAAGAGVDELPPFTRDVYLSYFWQQAPSPLVTWAARRYTVFFGSSTSALGIALGVILGAIGIPVLGLGWTFPDTLIVLTAACSIVILLVNGHFARREGTYMIELWLLAQTDQQMAAALGLAASPRAVSPTA